MKYVLCYGDSNTWGSSPEQLPRYEFNERWPGIVQNIFGEKVHIYENGLYGRTTGFNDDVEEGRNGKSGFRQIMEMYSPLDIVVIMLGSNDCKMRFSSHPAWDSALNMRQLAQEASKKCYGRQEKDLYPRVILVAPPVLGTDWKNSWVGYEFDLESSEKSQRLSELYKRIAVEDGHFFLDASESACTGGDCVHMTKESHKTFAGAVAAQIAKILSI